MDLMNALISDAGLIMIVMVGLMTGYGIIGHFLGWWPEIKQ